MMCFIMHQAGTTSAQEHWPACLKRPPSRHLQGLPGALQSACHHLVRHRLAGVGGAAAAPAHRCWRGGGLQGGSDADERRGGHGERAAQRGHLLTAGCYQA